MAKKKVDLWIKAAVLGTGISAIHFGAHYLGANVQVATAVVFTASVVAIFTTDMW